MKKIMIIAVALLLVGVEVYAGGLTGVTTKVTTFRTDLQNLIKVLAGVGLLFVVGSYTMSTDENKRFPWKWVIGAFAIGAFTQILTIFDL
jgi:RsiW-degrading membrane proteinase PrsW (M82 family)